MEPAPLRPKLGWKSGQRTTIIAVDHLHFCTACGFWDTGLNACYLGDELKLLLPKGVQRHELMAFDHSGGVVAIAERQGLRMKPRMFSSHVGCDRTKRNEPRLLLLWRPKAGPVGE